MISSLTSAPYASAVSMKLTPSSTARCSTLRASSRSLGSPQMPGPVKRMAPYPSRLMVRSPPIVKVPVVSVCSVVIPLQIHCPDDWFLIVPGSATIVGAGPNLRSAPSGAIKDLEHSEIIVRRGAGHEALDLAQNPLDGGTFEGGLQPGLSKKVP